MNGADGMIWDPGIYGRFRGLRLRPALDLLRSLPSLPEGPVVDLGCGAGAVSEALRATLGKDRHLVGVDASAEMLADARGRYDDLVQADIATWQPETPPALIFSNAALQWLCDHEVLLPRLAGTLAPGGVLAVQMPHQNDAPSHRTWLHLAHELFGVVPDDVPGILEAAAYHHVLAPLGEVQLWETTYFQVLAPSDDGHPVRRFTEATFARPLLRSLDPERQAALIAACDAAMAGAYPASEDGSVLFPFQRLFFTVRV